jgi:hypothetical protein
MPGGIRLSERVEVNHPQLVALASDREGAAPAIELQLRAPPTRPDGLLWLVRRSWWRTAPRPGQSLGSSALEAGSGRDAL